jgi:SpoVK/Ycf46/Vps4 family AAA+-type ATPase
MNGKRPMHETQDFIQLIRSNMAIVVIESREELRVLDFLQAASAQLRLPLYRWSVTDGLSAFPKRSATANRLGPEEMLRHIWNLKNAGLYVLLDFHPFVHEPVHVRLLKEISQTADKYQQTIVLLSHALDIPDELKHVSARFEFQLPEEKQLKDLIVQVARKWSMKRTVKKVQADREAVSLLIKNLRGLSFSEAERVILNAIQDGAITREDLPEAARAKYELLNRDEVITFEHDRAALSEVGGLRRLKKWLAQRKSVFVGQSSMKGIDLPRGVLLLGVQGGGKSLAAKSVASSWGVPLLRLDFGALFDKYYGETERKLRQSLQMAEKMSPCVLWLDEIEKGVATDASDGGTSKRVLGTLLTWMAERKSAVFIVATANDIQSLPAELMRKGRLDEIFFVDFPDKPSRMEIFKIHLQRRGLDTGTFDIDRLAQESEGFSGAEIEQAIVSALYSVVGNAGKLTDAQLLHELRSTRPLSIVMSEPIAAMRRWATDRTVPAN